MTGDVLKAPAQEMHGELLAETNEAAKTRISLKECGPDVPVGARFNCLTSAPMGQIRLN